MSREQSYNEWQVTKEPIKEKKRGLQKRLFPETDGYNMQVPVHGYRRVLYWTLFSPDESDSSVERALTWVDKVRSAIAIYSLQVNKNYLIDWQKQPKPFHQTDVIGGAHKIGVWKHLHCSIYRQSSWTCMIWTCYYKRLLPYLPLFQIEWMENESSKLS